MTRRGLLKSLAFAGLLGFASSSGLASGYIRKGLAPAEPITEPDLNDYELKTFDYVAFPLMRRVFQNLIAHEIISVQQMTAAAPYLHERMKFVYTPPPLYIRFKRFLGIKPKYTRGCFH